jgi:hypothetical protein
VGCAKPSPTLQNNGYAQRTAQNGWFARAERLVKTSFASHPFAFGSIHPRPLSSKEVTKMAFSQEMKRP